jgi:transcription antitermination protein NusB
VGVSGLRHRVRVTALQILFEVDLTAHLPDMVLERRLQEEPLSDEGKQFLYHLVLGVWEQRLFLDHLIETAAPNWPVHQMPGIDKAVLRIAIFELLVDQVEHTPVKAVINEAIELAKHFGSNNSSRFVNGVLGNVVHRKDETLDH